MAGRNFCFSLQGGNFEKICKNSSQEGKQVPKCKEKRNTVVSVVSYPGGQTGTKVRDAKLQVHRFAKNGTAGLQGEVQSLRGRPVGAACNIILGWKIEKRGKSAGKALFLTEKFRGKAGFQ
jgi:hypothetical protein